MTPKELVNEIEKLVEINISIINSHKEGRDVTYIMYNQLAECKQKIIDGLEEHSGKNVMIPRGPM